MTIYLVYGLTKDDSCDESYVKKTFKDKEKAFEYLNKQAALPSASETGNWYVEEMELE